MLDSEIMFHKSATNDDTTSNGGLMTLNYYTSGALAEVFPNALKSERTAGSTKYRKLHIKIANASDESLLNPQVWIDAPTDAVDWATFFAATHSDTEATVTGSERQYGSALLSTDATAATNTIIVTVEDASLTGMFVNGDTIRISDMSDPLVDSGNEEFHVINGVPSVAGSEVTMVTTDALANSYTVLGATRVMGVLEPSDIECSFDNMVKTGSGTYDESTYPIVCNNIGTVEDVWTLTFTDASNFTVSGANSGSQVAGSVAVDYSPVNADFTEIFFTLPYLGFGGTWAANDTIVFETHPASLPLWEKRVIPAGAASLSGNSILLVVAGEAL